ncbi:DUF1129 family protein [Paenibacillus macerans]|uniref:DUF1129 family protein n=1 Tax=Paenibacillus macerans TaxID=44252 RepID=A0A090Z602_PAEMA|nr:DUF1129 family protein [Paenibacillus macerans]KFN05590.1 hypothetical protein DJ90_305 [Paenibacillus macerans]MCY7559848.1 DUF1129 family protein [Paenibacillus macerans]MEC0151512.1 DUF1129 family protein [Paenibacillus macerans]SUA85526.1 Uncharacterized membrane-bound protein conserved in bacteria [Paenibacillus macerans]
MYIHEMIGETKKLRQQMTAENDNYFGEMVMYFRSGASSLTEAKGEEILLSLARQIVKNQDKGVSAMDLFGDDPKAYCAQLADDVLTGAPRSLKDKIIYYTMIPWVALTWVFFIYMITGFFSKWFGGELEYTLISSSSLLIIAGLAIMLVELVTRFLGPGRKRAAESHEPAESAESPEPSGPRRFDLKALGIYIGGAALLIALGTLLNRIMPAFTVSPWDSLIIFAIGLAGQIVLLRVRSKA